MPPLRALVTDPATFFDRVRDDPSLVGPTLVVVSHSLVVLAVLAIVFVALSELFEGVNTSPLIYAVGGQTVSAPRELVFGAAAAFASQYLVWVVVTGIAVLVTRYFDAEGSFRALLAAVGWTFLVTLGPSILNNAIEVALLVQAPTFESSAQLEEWVRTSVRTDPALQAVRYLRPVFSVWQVALWVIAVERVMAVTRRQAMLAVALPGLLVTVQALSTYLVPVLQ